MTAISLLALIWVALHMIQVSRDCLSSPIVSEVRFLGADVDEGARIQACSLTSYIRFWDRSHLQASHRVVKERIEILARATMLGFNNSVRPVSLEITALDPFEFRWQSDRLILGWEWVKAKGHLEKALLQEWLRRQNTVIQQDRFQLEVLGYLTLGFLKDKPVIEDPFAKERIDLAEPRSWLNWVLTLDQYCYSPWVSYDHLGLCHRTRQIKPIKKKYINTLFDIEKTALAPLVANLLWRRYSEASLSDKQQFWAGIKSTLHEQGVLSRWQWQSFLQPKNISELRDWVAMTTNIYWESLGFVSEGHHEWLPSDVAILIEGSSLPENRLQELVSFSQAKPEIDLILASGKGMVLLSGGQQVRLKAGGIRAHYHILASCGAVNKKDIKKVEEKRVLVVDFCKEGIEEINWSALINGGWESFIGENPSMKFLGLFMPSVRKFKSWPSLLHLDDHDFKVLATKLGWQSQNWDESLAAIRPSGVWDAVPFYRL